MSETGGGDFVTDGQATVTFAVGLDIASYTPVTADAVDESHGRVRVALVDGTAYDVDAARRALAVDVRDDDGTLLTLGAEPETLSVREGEPAQVGVAARTVADGTFTESGDFGRVFGSTVTSVTVNASTGGGTATAGGTDYTALPADTSVAVTFADMAAVGSGATAGFALASPVALPPIATAEDTEADPGETFEVTLMLPSGTDSRMALDPDTSTVTLVEGPAVTLVLDDDDLTEGETATVTATVEPVHTAAFTVTVATDPASSERFEFVGEDRTLSFAANATDSTGTVQIRAVDNDVDEADVLKGATDGFSVTGTVSDADVAAPAAVPFAVRDNDLPKVSIARPELAGAATGFVYEGETAMDTGRWKLTREGLTDAALTVTVRASETGGGDFVSFAADADQTVEFAANETVAYYTPVTVDMADEAHGLVAVTLQAGTAYEIEGAASAETNVRDDDGMLLTLGAEPETLSVREGDPVQVGVAARTVADGTFTESGDFGRVFGSTVTSVTVNASTGGGTATAGGTDYTALPPNTSVTVTFANMAAVGSGGSAGFALASPVALPPIATNEDTEADPDETFEVTLTLPSGTDSRMALDPDTSTVTLVEGPAVTLNLDDDDLTEGETATVTATVDPVHTAAFTVTVATDPTSSERFEFVGANRTLSFAANATESTGTVQIRAVDNDVDEADVLKGATDGFSVTGTVNDTNVAAPAAVPFALRDNDLPVVSIALSPGYDAGTHAFEAEAAKEAEAPWTLTREGLTDAALAVTVSVSETGGGDFVTDGQATVTFAADADSLTYTPVTADTVDEAHGSVTVALADGSAYDVDGDRRSATLAVRDDDGTLLTLGADPETLSVVEGSPVRVGVAARTVADGTFTESGDFERVFAGATSVTVNAMTGGGTATAADYTALASGTSVAVRFADLAAVGSGGAAGFALTTPVALPDIATAEDTVSDTGETFDVTLTLATGTDTRVSLSPAKATATIIEGPPDGDLRICGADGQCVSQAGVGCPASDPLCVTGPMRPKPVRGRIEVAQEGRFGTVCDDYWTLDDAHVACKSMGHAAGQTLFTRSHFGGAAMGVPIWYDDMRCTGAEAKLKDCRRNPGEHNCSPWHTEDAGVGCLAAPTDEPEVRVDPVSLTVRPGGSGRYWLALTKQPDQNDFWVAPQAPAGGVVTVSPERVWMSRHSSWSYAVAVDVSVSPGARAGESYTITHEANPYSYSDGSVPAVPDVTVTVGTPAGSVGVGGLAAKGLAATGAVLAGDTVEVSFDGALDSAFAPAPRDFVVLAGDVEVRVARASVRGAELLLELAAAPPAGTRLRIAYPPAPARALRDRSGLPAGPFELGVATGATAPDAGSPVTPVAALPAARAMGSAPVPTATKLEGAEGLAAVVAEALGTAVERAPATLWAPRRGVTELSGLERLPELRRLNLAENRVTDLSALAGLPGLRVLDLGGNAVEDLWPLAGLAELEVLDLSGNRVVDVSALGGLPRLAVLELAGNAVVDVSPLVHLTGLRYLGLAGNRVADTAPLAHLSGLVRLDLGGNAVLETGPLGNLSELVWLRLPGNRLERVDALGRLTVLRFVWVADNPLLAPDAAAVLPARTWVDTGAQ